MQISEGSAKIRKEVVDMFTILQKTKKLRGKRYEKIY